MYIFDQSFKNFWGKPLFEENSTIFGYIPQYYNDLCITKQKELAEEFRKKNKIPIIKSENINLPKFKSKKNVKEKNENDIYKGINVLLKKNIDDLNEYNDLLNKECKEYNNIINKIKEKENEIKKETIEKIKKENNLNFICNEIKRKEYIINIAKYFLETNITANNPENDIINITEEHETATKENISNERKIFTNLSINNNNTNIYYLGKKTKFEDDITT